MGWFSSRNVSDAKLPVPRDRIWELVTDPDSLASLTPLVASIQVDGDRWRWQLQGISALGVKVQPSFTEVMSFDHDHDGKDRIRFEHDDARTERAAAHGVYELADADGGTHLAVDITLSVELPLPQASRRAVERVMSGMMTRTGDRFASNLSSRLGLAEAVRPIRSR